MKSRSLTLRTLILVPPILILGASYLVSTLFLLTSSRDNAIESTIRQAQDTIDQFRILRGYYTQNVVGKIAATGALKVSFDHQGKPDTVPLPATMIHDLSDLLGKRAEGTRLSLYSDLPFPNRRGRTLDEFAEGAIAAMKQNPDIAVIRTGAVQGVDVVRVAIADKLSAPACVTCHNAHPDSPKRDWKLNDVRGVLEVDIPVARQIAAQRSMVAINAGIAATVVAIAGLSMLWLSSRRIVRPINEIIAGLAAMSDQVDTSAQALAGASQSLSQGASQQASSVEETSATLEELSSIVGKEAERSTQTGSLAQQARTAASKGSQGMARMLSTIKEIKDAADQTARIVKTIDEIAFQTNLLALNAAVEAARAGDSGRGFAVVAEEVRALAQRSADAARSTSSLIARSQTSVASGVEVAQQVERLLTDADKLIASLSELVQQAAQTAQQEAQGIQQISTAMSGLDMESQTRAAGAEELAATGEELMAHAGEMARAVERLRFLIGGQRVKSGDHGALPMAAPSAQLPRL